MAGSPMAPVSNLGFPGGGGYDTSTEKGWLQTYYPNHEWLQPGGKYGPAPSFSGDPTGSSPGTGQFDISTEKGWLQTYYPNHPDLQAGGKYGGAGPINFNNIVGMGVTPTPVESANNPNTVGGTGQPPGYPYGSGMDFGLGDPGFGGQTGQMTNIDFGLGLPSAQTPITGMTEREWEEAFAPNAPDLQPGGKYYTGGGGNFSNFGMGSTTGMNQDYAAGVTPTAGATIQPGTAAATLGGGMTAEDAATQFADYQALQSRLAAEAAWYEAQQRSLPSSPQNYQSMIVDPYSRNFGGQIAGYNPFSTQYQSY